MFSVSGSTTPAPATCRPNGDLPGSTGGLTGGGVCCDLVICTTANANDTTATAGNRYRVTTGHLRFDCRLDAELPASAAGSMRQLLPLTRLGRLRVLRRPLPGGERWGWLPLPVRLPRSPAAPHLSPPGRGRTPAFRGGPGEGELLIHTPLRGRGSLRERQPGPLRLDLLDAAVGHGHD